jgi:hypothetical protein
MQFDDASHNIATDRKASESFLRELVYDLSDVVFVVVNQLTLSDQIFIREMQFMIERAQANKDDKKRIIMIHNFRELKNATDVETKIRTGVWWWWWWWCVCACACVYVCLCLCV